MKQFYENFVYPLHKNDTIANYVEMKKDQQIKIKQLRIISTALPPSEMKNFSNLGGFLNMQFQTPSTLHQ